MKNLIVIAMLVYANFAFAQSKNEKASIKVDGVCMMCKERIEKASIKTKGVKSADWNVKTHELKLIYNSKKTSLDDIKKSILAVGHDTENLHATDVAYNSVHPCCKYREEDVKESHEEGNEKK